MPLVTPDLIRWQRGVYPLGHVSRRNLTLHLLSAPLYPLGLLAILTTPLHHRWGVAAVGLLGMLIALFAQGAGHRGEARAPDPFLSPLDFVARFTVENCFNFWRFLFSGELAKAWRAAA